MATYAAFKHVELHKIGYGKNRVPNAPRGRISEIFNGDEADGRAANGNGVSARSVRAPRSPRDTPVRPRDTHSRLFGQGGAPPPAPLVTDTVRSNIRFGDAPDAPHANGSRGSSPAKSPLLNGASVSPSRESADASPLVRRDPVTGDGISVPPAGRRWAAARSREGNPITGDGYKSLNGEINMAVTALNGNHMPIHHNRIPPGGYSSGLW